MQAGTKGPGDVVSGRTWGLGLVGECTSLSRPFEVVFPCLQKLITLCSLRPIRHVGKPGRFAANLTCDSHFLGGKIIVPDAPISFDFAWVSRMPWRQLPI
jgi:hypothetical protein